MKSYLKLLLFVLALASSIPALALHAQESMPQGFSPFAIAITNDGKYAYVSFDLSEVVFKIRLADLTVDAVADLSDYFSLGSCAIALDVSERKVFVHARTLRKLLVLDSQTMQIIHVIDDFAFPISFFRSRYSPSLITWDGGPIVKFVNTETYAVTEFIGDQMKFAQIRESDVSSDKWYVVSGNPREGYKAGEYDLRTKAWMNAIDIPLQASGETVKDFEVMPNEQKLYVATFGGWYAEAGAYGWLYSIELMAKSTKVLPIDGGPTCLKASRDNQWLIVGTGWPVPYSYNVLLLSAHADTVVGQINLGQNKYSCDYTQMNALVIDPANPQLLYATSTDGNALIKIDLGSRTLTDVLVLNRQDFRPHFFVKRPMQKTAYVLIHQSPYAFEVDLENGTMKGVVRFPVIRTDAWVYDVASYGNERLLVAQGELVLEVDANDMHLIANHWLPNGVSFWHFILSKNQRRMYLVSYAEEYPNSFQAINTDNFQLEASIRLEGGNFNVRPYELPDGSKIYTLGGQQSGQVVVHVIGTNPYLIRKTIILNEPGLLGITTPLYYPFAYDSSSHTLFVGATQVVLAIDTETDAIKRVIHLEDAAKAIGLEPWQLTYLNATGLVYNPKENCLYIAHLDRSFMSIYDLSNGRFLPKVIPLKGYFPTCVIANDDFSKIYSPNIRSDNISVIDTHSKTVERVIDLHAYPMVAPPQPPSLEAPVDSMKNASLISTLSWNTSQGATTYHLQLSTVSTFTSTVVDDSTVTTTSRTVGRLSLATTYYWRVRAGNDGGWSKFSPARLFSTIRTTLAENLGSETPEEYALSQNYPNPFNPATIIQFALPKESRVSLKVFDLLGREVATLVSEALGPGYFSVRWLADVPSGTYIYRLQAGEFVETKKMILLQ